MFLITGATGNVGGTLVRLLAEQGHAVRALVRNPATASLPEGVEVVVGDLDDPASINAAAKGVEAVFHMQAGPFPAQTETVIAAARDGGALMSNALWWRDSIRRTGTVSDPCGDGRMPCVDSDDIAAAAAVTLTRPGHDGHGYILCGPEALTTREQVDILADILGRPIRLVETAPREHAEASVAHGLPARMGPVIENLYAMFRTGRAGVLTDDLRNLTGRAPGTFRAWCERHAAAFGPAR